MPKMRDLFNQKGWWTDTWGDAELGVQTSSPREGITQM